MTPPYGSTAGLYDIAHRNKDYSAESRYVVDIVDRVHPGAKTLLDVGCGTGGHLQHLAQRFHAEGLDASREMLDLAAQRISIPLHLGDMRTFSLEKTFDVVTCLFSSIGYVRPLEAMEDAIANLCRHVSPGGLLIVEPWVIPQNWRADHIDIESDPEAAWVRMTSAFRRGTTSRLETHWLVGRGTGISHHTESHALELYTIDQYTHAFEAVCDGLTFDAEGPTGRGLFTGRVAP